MAFRNRTAVLLIGIASGFLVMAAGNAAPLSSNSAPVISGLPPATVLVGMPYSFQPLATDPDRQRLRFSISNRPAWAKFNTTTGKLSGTPLAANVGITSGIVITVSDGSLSASLAPFSITVSQATNRAPVISGTPPTGATLGVAFTFTPTASDPDGDALTWSITAKPAGASFSVATGQLGWTPTAAGTWSGIVITVTDSRGASASLPSFSITVPPAASSGSATLNWVPPTQYTDGSALPASDLTAFRIYSGTSATTLGRIAEVDSATTNFSVQNLPSGTHFFAVTAVTLAGVESAPSTTGSKAIP
jgi:hypothetical protein